MKTGNSVPAASHHSSVPVRDASQRQLRDIEELVAKLQVVTKQLESPVRSTPDRVPGDGRE